MLVNMESPWSSLSIFFPAYNEAAVLPGVIERAVATLERLGPKDYELIIVNDGSSDDTVHVAEELAVRFPKVRLVSHPANRGYGAALITGFQSATKEWVVFTDGDGQFRLDDLERFWAPSEQYDVVLGYRRSRRDHLGRMLNARLWSWAVWLILGVKVQDLDCGFKLFRTSSVRSLGELTSTGAVISAELLIRLKRSGASFAEVPVEHYLRDGGQPTGARLSVILRAFRELVALRRTMGR